MEHEAARSQTSEECRSTLLEGYRQMALDREQEAEAEEWVEGLIGDGLDVSDCSV